MYFLKCHLFILLIHYFQTTCRNGIFELKGVKTESVQNRMLFDDSIHKARIFNVSFAIAIYSLCYSTQMPRLCVCP